MRLSILAAVVAIFISLFSGCTNPNVPPDQVGDYNTMVFGFWIQVVGAVVALVTPLVVWLVNRNVSQKLDVQQDELLRKADRQTHAIVATTEKAVEQAAALQPADNGARDRRATDKPVIGG